MTYFDIVLALILFLILLGRGQFGIRLDVFAVQFSMLVVFSAANAGTSLYYFISRQKRSIPMPKRRVRQIAASAWEIAGIERLTSGEILVGYNGRRPIKVNIAQEHTLVSGSTGGGKTYFIHQMMIQFASMGPRFWNMFDVYLIDLKGIDDERMWRWKPFLAGFVQGSTESAAVLIDQIMRQRGEKRSIVIIDEVANMTRGGTKLKELVEKFAMQYRSSGSIIALTQMPHHTVTSTLFRYNFVRRICFRIVELDHARRALGTNGIRTSDVPTEVGQFLIRSPEYNLGRGKTLNISDIEIDDAVRKGMELISEEDQRLSILLAAAGSFNEGDVVTGINKLREEVNLGQNDVMYAYRNFANAGAFEKRKNRYVLIVPFSEAFSLVSQYIRDGKWQAEPR